MMFEYQSKTIDDVSIAYQLSEPLKMTSNKPVVLFGHSYLWDSHMWREQVAQLQEQFICVLPDLPAHGKSGLNANAIYSIDKLANYYAALMQALNIHRYAIVGLSVGGMWGAKLALDYPERVTGLVMMDTFVGPEPEGTREKYFALLERVEQDGFTPALTDNLLSYFLTPASIQHRPDLVKRFKAPFRTYNERPDRRMHLCQIGRAIFTRPSLLERLVHLSMPIKIMVGEQDIPRPPAESELMAGHCQNGDCVVIKDAAHISNLEQADIVTNHLFSFLTRCYDR